MSADVLNRPDVLDAYDTLRRAGLLQAKDRATIFCAYCGEHICYAPVDADRQGPAEDDNTSELMQVAVALHRSACQKYKMQEAISKTLGYCLCGMKATGFRTVYDSNGCLVGDGFQLPVCDRHNVTQEKLTTSQEWEKQLPQK